MSSDSTSQRTGATALTLAGAGLIAFACSPGGPAHGGEPEAARDDTSAPHQVQNEAFVADADCASCHEDEYAEWTGSHHDLAMQEVSDQSVRGDFGDATFEGIEEMRIRLDLSRDDDGIGGDASMSPPCVGEFDPVVTNGFDFDAEVDRDPSAIEPIHVFGSAFASDFGSE